MLVYKAFREPWPRGDKFGPVFGSSDLLIYKAFWNRNSQPLGPPGPTLVPRAKVHEMLHI